MALVMAWYVASIFFPHVVDVTAFSICIVKLSIQSRSCFNIISVDPPPRQMKHTLVVVDLPLLCVAVEGSDNPIIQSSPARRPFHLASRGTTLSGDIQRSSMLLEVYKCVQLNRWFVVCGRVLQKGGRGVVGFVDFV